MYDSDDLIPLSALQHLIYCERQAALIHLERVWVDNVYTVEGKQFHDVVDAGQFETRKDVRIVRRLAVRSLRLGLSGVADVVEFHKVVEADGEGIAIPRASGRWRPFPVEYKRGKPKSHFADEVQLCAQAICLEEMLVMAVPEGALFYGKTRRRKAVVFDRELRELTERSARRMHEILASSRTPPAIWGEKCNACSLVEVCQPKLGDKSATAYTRRLFRSGDKS